MTTTLPTASRVEAELAVVRGEIARTDTKASILLAALSQIADTKMRRLRTAGLLLKLAALPAVAAAGMAIGGWGVMPALDLACVLFCLAVAVTGTTVLIHLRGARGHGPGCRPCRWLNRLS